jgi:hypothetical protein
MQNKTSWPELFQAAGASFSFERDRVAELMAFVETQLELKP